MAAAGASSDCKCRGSLLGSALPDPAHRPHGRCGAPAAGAGLAGGQKGALCLVSVPRLVPVPPAEGGRGGFGGAGASPFAGEWGAARAGGAGLAGAPLPGTANFAKLMTTMCVRELGAVGAASPFLRHYYWKHLS